MSKCVLGVRRVCRVDRACVRAFHAGSVSMLGVCASILFVHEYVLVFA